MSAFDQTLADPRAPSARPSLADPDDASAEATSVTTAPCWA